MLPISLPQIILFVVLLIWLGVCVFFDLRSREVPTALTIPPLILAALWRLLQDEWQFVALVLALALISDLARRRLRVLFASLASALVLWMTGSPGLFVMVITIWAVWVMWEQGAIGGADAKLIITLVLFFGDGWLVIPILLAGGFQGVIGLLRRQKSVPYTVAITLGTAAWLWMKAVQPGTL